MGVADGGRASSDAVRGGLEDSTPWLPNPLSIRFFSFVFLPKHTSISLTRRRLFLLFRIWKLGSFFSVTVGAMF